MLKTQAEIANVYGHALPGEPSNPPKKKGPTASVDTGRRDVLVVMGKRGTQFADGVLHGSDVHFELVHGARLVLPASATLADICVPTPQPT